ncbi:MAG TPA: DUF1906 domain-containing protein [Bacteroidia bacterium]|nr:DUF1906 domain-containing protein [Bacteroidia bacterium]
MTVTPFSSVSSSAPGLPGKVVPAAPGLKGFDTVATISASLAAQFVKSGYSFCARYLSLGQGQNAGDLTAAEATDILNGGLALIAVQRVRKEGWVPSASLGSSTGTNAANNGKSVGLPAGMNVFLDLEGVASGTSAQAVIDYCQAWYAAVSAAGYVPGIYVGAGSVLNSSQLYSNLSFQHYWKSQSKVPDVAVRGYQLVQAYPSVQVNGIYIDEDTTQNDNKGGTVLWLAKQPTLAQNPANISGAGKNA